MAAAAAIAAVLGTSFALAEFGKSSYILPFNEEPIDYDAPAADPVARLMKQIETGDVTLDYHKTYGYLPSLLEALDIPASSQMLVFSKTSLQTDFISPRTPRAIYFNDEIYVGYVQGGGLIEIASVDPAQGTMFYSLRQQPPAAGASATIARDNQCLQCHAAPRTLGVPGLIVRSVYADATGMPLFNETNFDTDHRSPLAQRWGGWYVTGTHGEQRHMGNITAWDEASIDLNAGANVTDLSQHIDTSKYLSPHSDIVALMVLEHQIYMHNLITRVNYETRLALRDRAAINAMSDLPPDTPTESTQRRIERACEQLLRYMLFVDEEILTDPIQGTSAFAAEFAARGPRDSQGRSLRDLDLRRWLFEYPCSFLIYSEAFDALPDEAKQHIYQRLWTILNGKDTTGDYRSISTRDRKAILQILRETKKALPAYWHENAEE